MPSKDLNDIVYCLTHDKDGTVRLTEKLTSAALYKRHHPDHHQYWELIAAEIQCFGVNTLVTILRGDKGVSYKQGDCITLTQTHCGNATFNTAIADRYAQHQQDE